MSDRPPAERKRRIPIAPWLLRAAWVAVLVFGGPAIEGDVARAAAGIAWLGGVAAMALLSVPTLTATRVIVSISVPAAVTAWIAGAETADGLAFTVAAVVATSVALSAEVGRAFVQASAYGDEDRHLLRPPVAYAMAAVVTWAVWAATAIAGPPLLDHERWVLGGVCCAAAVAIAVWGWQRWHALSRRWFVLVPAGVVVHDHVVLAETLMVRRIDITGLRLAPAGTEAADLTGPASGHAVELIVREPVTAILAASPSKPRGTVIHLTAGLVSPSRPGRLLMAAKARRLPVG